GQKLAEEPQGSCRMSNSREKPHQFPSYRLHKQSGRAITTLTQARENAAPASIDASRKPALRHEVAFCRLRLISLRTVSHGHAQSAAQATDRGMHIARWPSYQTSRP